MAEIIVGDVRIVYPVWALRDGSALWMAPDTADGEHQLRLFASNRLTALRGAVSISIGFPYPWPTDLGEVWA